MFAVLSDPTTWMALLKIAVINVVLSGDNAVVIALACRSLPPKDQKKAFIVGCAGIVVLMTLLTSCAALLMTVPYIQIIGCVLLLWIGIKLLLPEDEGGNVKESSNFWGAVKTIIIADIVMSMDNVLGMAGAAQGHLGMLFLGLVITMPLILFGSAALVKLMERFPSFVTIGAGVLGYVAGDMAIGDPAVKTYVDTHVHFLELVAPILGALLVVVAGKMLAHRKHVQEAAAQIIAPEQPAQAEHAI
ncbi:MAG TPA: YjbE family putative metal transport protein [Casimicrobiaceae bacterium]|jgi:YjbE family integral membrane protein|nr:YjbE family putative metal transport protein [Casimicrobiaceae bacterium]